MFYVYVNEKRGTATLHRAGCEDCNEGQGKQLNGVKPQAWRGPFESTAEAGRAVAGIPLGPCRKCRPYMDW